MKISMAKFRLSYSLEYIKAIAKIQLSFRAYRSGKDHRIHIDQPL